MKKVLSLVLAFAMAVSVSACSANTGNSTASGKYTAGTYEAKAKGMGGDVIVTVTVDENDVKNVEVDVSCETPGYGQDHGEEYADQLLKANGGEIEGVAGCTITSDAIREAYAQALAMARGAEKVDVVRNTEADVIILGAGGAGLSAAAEAVKAGSSVIVLESNAFAGGATSTSGGNFLSINPEENKTAERNDTALEKYSKYTVEDFPEQWQPHFTALMDEIAEYKTSSEAYAFDSVNRAIIDHFISGDGYDLDGNRVNLDYNLIVNSLNANVEIKDWLVDAGMTTKGGATAGSHYTAPTGKGSEMIETLVKLADGADIQYNTRATGLVETDGRITGVEAVDENGNVITYTAKKGVIIATGGFTSNTEKVAEYQNQFKGMNANNPSNEPASIQGDGIWMAMDKGAKVQDMAFITTMLKGYNNLATSGEESTTYNSAMLAVNVNGDRFIDDKPASGPAAKVRYVLNDEPEAIMFAIGDQKMIDAMNEATEGLANTLIERGIAWKADTLEEAAKLAGLDAEKLTKTVETFNGYVDIGEDKDFGRTEFNGKVEEGPVYIAKLQSAYHLTFGGLAVDDQMRVLDEQSQPIEGLYAAGDAVGNFEGTVHQSGFCITIVLYSGRTAGQCARAN